MCIKDISNFCFNAYFRYTFKDQVMVILVEIELRTQVQILDKAVHVSLYTNAIEKGMNSSLLLFPTMGK